MAFIFRSLCSCDLIILRQTVAAKASKGAGAGSSAGDNDDDDDIQVETGDGDQAARVKCPITKTVMEEPVKG